MSKAKTFLLVTAGALPGFLAGLLLERWFLADGRSGPAQTAKQELPSPKPAPPTKVATSLDLRGLLEKVAADQTVASGWPGGSSRVDPASGFCRNHDSVVYQLKDAKQGDLIADGLDREIEMHLERSGAMVFRRHDLRSNAGAAQIRNAVRGYRLAGRSGQVLVWVVHHNDCLSVVVFHYENEGEETVPAPIPGHGGAGLP